MDLVLNGRFVLGDELDEFESRAATIFGAAWCVGTSSGTSALALALKAGLPPKSRVALPTNTYFATFEAVIHAGHIPVLLDNDQDYTIWLDQLETLEIDAVIAVHLYGLPCDMESLMQLASRKGWLVIEDASQAHGAFVGDRPVGSLGHMAAFSAYPTKNLGAWGDAGFVTGQDPSMEEQIRQLRNHGQQERDHHLRIGGTDRLDNLQALVLTEKLKTLGEEVDSRRSVAAKYRSLLSHSHLDLPQDVALRRHAFHQFVLRIPNRDIVREGLAKRGIGTSVHYPTPIHRQPGAKGLFDAPYPFTRADSWAPTLLSLPMYPSLSDDEISEISNALRGEVEKVTAQRLTP